ncbi:MAG: chorismate-binding protein [Candidatus Omnitrophota bacterium]
MSLPVYIETIPADRFTPVVVFKKLNGKALLESAVLEIGKSRYSIILVEEAFRLVLNNRGVLKYEGLKEEILSPDPHNFLSILEGQGKNVASSKDFGMPIPASGIGYLGYETAALFDKIHLSKQDDELQLPDAIFLFGSLFIVFDHYKDELYIIAIDYDGQGKEKIKTVKERLMDFDFRAYQTDENFYHCTGQIEAGKEAYISGVKKLKEHIRAGDIVQGVLSRRITIKTFLDPLDAYCRLRRINPSPYLFYFDFTDFKLFGSSPELMVSYNDGTATIKPIAGTRSRGKTRQEDIALEKDLLADEKERAEHLMLVDLARNDLGRTAKPGTVSPRSLYSVERYSHVMHIVSEIGSQVARDYNAYDLIRTTFPAGTVTGAPKIKAMELVSDYENVKRGPYAGLVGHFDMNGNFDSCITIRSMIHKEGTYYIQVGAGIVYDSVPEREFDETMKKAGAMIRSLGINLESGL